jgi:anti-sigma regulatory factor (Ser/Thr protein kinase)
VEHIPAEARVVEWLNPCSARGLAAARENVADVLTAWSLDDLVLEAQLLISELLGNVVLHTTCTESTVRICLVGERTVRVEVGDSRRDKVATLLPKHPSNMGGIGLHILSAAAPRWGCNVHEQGKIVWFELDGRA